LEAVAVENKELKEEIQLMRLGEEKNKELEGRDSRLRVDELEACLGIKP